MPYSVMLDAGHGGANPGAVYEGRQEKDDALALVLAIGPILEANGIQTLYTRTTDVYQTPFEKAQLANEAAGLKNEIIKRGDIPFYGTSVSNYHSRNIALNCGFKPMWVELGANRIK